MRELRRLLGPELNALIADAEHTPPQEAARRLEGAQRVVELLRPIEKPAAIRAWFLGLNPLLSQSQGETRSAGTNQRCSSHRGFGLDDTPPALALAKDPEAVLKAARAFAAHG